MDQMIREFPDKIQHVFKMLPILRALLQQPEPDIEKCAGLGAYLFHESLKFVTDDNSAMLKCKVVIIMNEMIKLWASKLSTKKILLRFLPGFVSGIRVCCMTSVAKNSRELVKRSVDLLGNYLQQVLSCSTPKELEEADLNLRTVLTNINEDLALAEEFDILCNLNQKILKAGASKLPLTRRRIGRYLLLRTKDSSLENVASSIEILKKLVPEVYDFDMLYIILDALSNSTNFEDMKRTILYCRQASHILSAKPAAKFPIEPLMKIMQIIMYGSCTQRGLISTKVLLQHINFEKMTYGANAQGFHELVDLCSSFAIFYTPEDIFSEAMHTLEKMKVQNPLDTEGQNRKQFIGTIRFCNLLMKTPCVINGLKQSSSVVNIASVINYYCKFLEVLDVKVASCVQEHEVHSKLDELQFFMTLFLEGIYYMGMDHNEYFAPLIFCTLTEHASCHLPDIEESADILVKKLYKPTLQSFLSQRYDSILSELTVRVSNPSIYPLSSKALIYLAKEIDFSESRILAVLQPMFELNAVMQGSLAMRYAELCYATVLSLYSHLSPDHLIVTQPKEKNADEVPIEISNLLKFQSHFLVDLSDTPTINSQESKDYDLEDEEVTSKSPNSNVSKEVLIRNICYKMLNLVPHRLRSINLLAMECLMFGFKSFRLTEDLLLPLVHVSWNKVLCLLHDTDFVLRRKGFEVIIVICETSGTFMRRRIVNEFFPMLPKLVQLSLRDSSSSSRYNQSQKFLQLIMTEIADVLQNLDIQDKYLETTCSWILDSIRPRQHEAMKIGIKKLVQMPKSRCLWMKLISRGVLVVKDLDSFPRSSQYQALPAFCYKNEADTILRQEI